MPSPRAFRLAWTLAAAAALSACGFIPGTSKVPGASSKVKVSAVDAGDEKQTLLVATAKQDGALFFTRPPYDLNGAWRAEATCSLPDARTRDAAVGALFGLEVDQRGTTPDPVEFYGVYARRFLVPETGLQVFASSRDGNHGNVFFADATSVDLAVTTDGATVTFLARDSAVGGAYTTVGTRTLEAPSAVHNAGFGMFGAAKGASFGFTNFRVPVNGTPAAPPPPEQAALNDVYGAALLVLEAVYAVDGPVAGPPRVTDAVAGIDQAIGALTAARATIEGLPEIPGKAATRKERALAAVDKALKELGKAKSGFEKKDAKAIAPFLRAAAKKLFTSAFAVTDALLSDELRATLPGGALPK